MNLPVFYVKRNVLGMSIHKTPKLRLRQRRICIFGLPALHRKFQAGLKKANCLKNKYINNFTLIILLPNPTKINVLNETI